MVSSRGRGARGSWARRAPSGGVGAARVRGPASGICNGIVAVGRGRAGAGSGTRWKVSGEVLSSGPRRCGFTVRRPSRRGGPGLGPAGSSVQGRAARPTGGGGRHAREALGAREERGRRWIRSGRWRACARGPQGLRPRPASAHSSASYRSARWRCRWASPSSAPTTAANHPARPRAMTEPPPRARGGAALLRRPGGTPTCSNPRVPAPGAQARSPERRAGPFPPPPDVVFAHPTGPERGPCRSPPPGVVTALSSVVSSSVRNSPAPARRDRTFAASSSSP